ncbi:WD40 repeat-like protein [Rhizopus microsporus]|uniref:WD40 repeat-like protein n=1 Tax=Rhizopus microsporus TaxID=58291 RepID=A0A1X0S7K9_RHIZD|nr:WD40 repeat-like protein [Rhizopus microsporus]
MAPYPTRLELTLKGHKGPVNDVCYNHSGQYCLSAGRDRSIRLWNPSTGLLLHTYTGHSRDALAVTASPDNAKIASGGADRSVILWDVGSGEILRRYTAHWERVNSVGFNDQSTVLISASFDATIRLWDLRSMNLQPIQIIEDCKDSVMSVHIRDTEIIAGCADGRLRTYDIRKGELKEDYIGSPITSAKITKDGNCILVSSLDSTVRLMDKSNGKLLNEFKGHKHKEYKIESILSNKDEYAITGSEDGKIYIYDVLEAKVLSTIEAHQGVATTLDYHPENINMLEITLYKTEFCRNWIELGHCRYGTKCLYAHGEKEIRTVPRHARYKTQICRAYHSDGSCPYGVRCTFIHDSDYTSERRDMNSPVSNATDSIWSPSSSFMAKNSKTTFPVVAMRNF